MMRHSHVLRIVVLATYLSCVSAALLAKIPTTKRGGVVTATYMVNTINNSNRAFRSVFGTTGAEGSGMRFSGIFHWDGTEWALRTVFDVAIDRARIFRSEEGFLNDAGLAAYRAAFPFRAEAFFDTLTITLSRKEIALTLGDVLAFSESTFLPYTAMRGLSLRHAFFLTKGGLSADERNTILTTLKHPLRGTSVTGDEYYEKGEEREGAIAYHLFFGESKKRAFAIDEEGAYTNNLAGGTTNAFAWSFSTNAFNETIDVNGNGTRDVLSFAQFREYALGATLSFTFPRITWETTSLFLADDPASLAVTNSTLSFVGTTNVPRTDMYVHSRLALHAKRDVVSFILDGAFLFRDTDTTDAFSFSHRHEAYSLALRMRPNSAMTLALSGAYVDAGYTGASFSPFEDECATLALTFNFFEDTAFRTGMFSLAAQTEDIAGLRDAMTGRANAYPLLTYTARGTIGSTSPLGSVTLTEHFSLSDVPGNGTNRTDETLTQDATLVIRQQVRDVALLQRLGHRFFRAFTSDADSYTMFTIGLGITSADGRIDKGVVTDFEYSFLIDEEGNTAWSLTPSCTVSFVPVAKRLAISLHTAFFFQEDTRLPLYTKTWETRLTGGVDARITILKNLAAHAGYRFIREDIALFKGATRDTAVEALNTVTVHNVEGGISWYF